MSALDQVTAPLERSAGPDRSSAVLAARRGAVELALLAALYVAYSASRLLADNDPSAARDRADWLLGVEKGLGLAWESRIVEWVTDNETVGLAASYFYATAHYVVTAAVLLWLYRRGPKVYAPARRALLLATSIALVGYLVVPMAPPRLAGYTDVLKLHATDGWWGAEASAPRGFGELTNQFAAMPSMHAGWALWVAIALAWAGVGPGWRLLAATYAAVSALIVVATGNHWVLDAVVGWLVIVVSAWLCRPRSLPRAGARRVPDLAVGRDGGELGADLQLAEDRLHL